MAVRGLLLAMASLVRQKLSGRQAPAVVAPGL